MTPAWKRRLWILVAMAGLVLIFRVTLLPTSDPDTGTFHWCLMCGALGLSDTIGNVVLFAPLAVALFCAGMRWWKVVGLLFLLSTTIELVQLGIPGRESALGDVLSNTAGALAGVGLAWWLPRRRRSARAGFVAAAAAVGLIGATGFAFEPSFPRTIYYGQWTNPVGAYDTYEGKVLSAGIAGAALPPWRLDDSRTVRQGLLDGAPLRVRAVAGPSPRALAPIFNIYDDRQREVLLLGADRDDLVLHLRLRATDLLLRQPDLRWRGALAAVTAGDTIVLELRRAAPGYCLSLNDREHCGMAYTAGQAWGLIQFFPRLPASIQTGFSVLFMAVLGMCVGLFVRRDAAGYLAVGVVLAGALVVPLLVGLAVTPPLELGGLALGLAGAAFFP